MEQVEKQLQLDEMGTMGPGRYLKNARQNKKLLIEDVAFELRLTPAQVTALEEDDYSHMPEVTYVRGYLRNYARLLGLSPDEVLLAHSRITREDDLVSVTVAPVREREIHAVGAGIKFLAVLIVLALIGAVAYWYMGREAELGLTEVSPKPQETQPTKAEEYVPTGSSKLTLSKPESAAPTPAPVSASSAQGQGAVAEADTKPEDATGKINNDAKPGGTAAARDATTGAEIPAVSAEPVVAKPESTAAVAEKQVADAGIGKLVIHYSKSCWTDIRDASGKKLVYRTVPAGETIRVEGKTPITLFFGFAVGIDLTFNGQPVDLKQHTRGVFARLVLGN